VPAVILILEPIPITEILKTPFVSGFLNSILHARAFNTYLPFFLKILQVSIDKILTGCGRYVLEATSVKLGADTLME
jgi:hypothetical protein